MIFANNQITTALFSPNKHDIDVKQFSSFSSDERKAFYGLRGAKTDIMEACQAIVSCFNYSKASNQLSIALSKADEKPLAVLFKTFVCATHAMAENMKTVDMRNEQTAEVCKIIATYDFDSAEEITAPNRPINTNDVDLKMVEKMTDSLKTIVTLMDDYKITVETAGSILASAWYFNHPTFQQDFLRGMLMVSQAQLYEHQKREQSNRTLTDGDLIKVLSGLVAIASNSYLPRI